MNRLPTGFGDDALDPLKCRTFDHIAGLLRDLRTAANLMSYRDITRFVNDRRAARRIPERVGMSTVYDCFKDGRKRLDYELIGDIGAVLGLDAAGLARLQQACLIAGDRAEENARADVRDRLPGLRAEFVGRRDEFRRAVEAVQGMARQGRPPVLFVTGPAGIGKTEFAQQFVHRALESGYCGDVQLFCDLHGFDVDGEPTDPKAVLGGFLKLLGCSSSEVAILDTLGRRVERFRRLLSGKQAVIVLDNAVDADHVRSLLPDEPTHMTVITSRSRFNDESPGSRITLEPLDTNTGLELLRRFDSVGRIDAEQAAAVRLAENVCYGIPFDLVSLGAQLADRQRNAWTLGDHEARLARFSPDEISRPVLASSYQSLDPQVRRVFRLTAAIPAWEFSGHEVAVLVDIELADAEDALERMYDLYLLRRQRPGKYRFHDITHAYAEWLLRREDPDSAVREALLRLREASTRRLDASA